MYFVYVCSSHGKCIFCAVTLAVYMNFSFKKRNLPEALHDSPTRKKLNFYPLPNSTENEEDKDEKPSFATVIGGALPNFRDGLGSFP